MAEDSDSPYRTAESPLIHPITPDSFRYEGREYCDDCEYVTMRERCWSHPQHLGKRKCAPCWERATGVRPGIRQEIPVPAPPPEPKYARGPLKWRGLKMQDGGVRVEHVRNDVEGLGTVADHGVEFAEFEWLKFVLEVAGFDKDVDAAQWVTAMTEQARINRGPK